MRRQSILIFCFLILSGCAKVETTSNQNIQTNLNKLPVPSPTVEPDISLKPVTPKIKLNATEKKFLGKSLPLSVREILEKAEKFEVLAEVNVKDMDEGLTLEPNRILKVVSEEEKRKILEIFFKDAATDEPPATCFIPHHGIRATYQTKTVEIEICFDCSRFFVKSSFGEFEGTIVRENRKSEDFFNQIIQNQSVEIK